MLRKLLRKLEKSEKQLSSQIYTEGTVVSKMVISHEGLDPLEEILRNFGFLLNYEPIKVPSKEYMVRIMGNGTYFDLNDENLFHRTSEGERVGIIYREVYNLSDKSTDSRKPVEYKVETVNKSYTTKPSLLTSSTK